MISLIGLLTIISPACHTTTFVKPFTASSSNYYRLESERLLSGADIQGSSKRGGLHDIAAYLQHVRTRIEEEGAQADSVLGKDVKGTVIRVVEENLVGNHVHTILENGFNKMADAGDTGSLRLLYSMLGKVDGLPDLRGAFQDYVKAKGILTVSDASKDDTMIDGLIELQTSLDAIVSESFNSDFTFRKAYHDSFKSAMQTRGNKVAEMIAKYLDLKLRGLGGFKNLSDNEIEELFTRILNIFKFVQDKDFFKAFYKNYFAKRLLLNKSASFDFEKLLLIKLKDECGPVFTANLETMVKDIDLSADIMKAYKELLGEGSSSIMSVNILTTGNWPTYHRQPILIPDHMIRELTKFTSFYKLKYTGRSLMYMHSLDACTLKVEFAKGPGGGKKEILVSLHQTVVLLLFEDLEKDAKLGFKEIQERSGLEAKEVMRTLQSLACGKYKILVKQGDSGSKDVHQSDDFSFNHKFKDEKYKLKINQIQLKETVEEQQHTTKQVLLDRQSHLQLIIVRILKSKKTVKHNQLIMEVLENLKDRFKVETIDIKKAIDSLIERDYMEREGRDAYNYLA